MLKGLFIFILGMLYFQAAKAQKQDTVLLYMKNNNKIVDTKDSADYALLIITPPDSSSGVKVNSIEEFYLGGKRKLIGTAVINISPYRWLNIRLVGVCIYFYENGHRKSMINYKDGLAIGIQTFYYPNGKLYATERYDEKWHRLLIDCHDSTGKVLAVNGDGYWVKFDTDFKKEISEGPVKYGFEDGQWHEMTNDTTKYITIYKEGTVTYTNSPNTSMASSDQIFAAVEQEPSFREGGAAGFNKFLAGAVIFPAYDRQMGTQGKVIVTFVVEKDGTLSDVKALRGPSQSIMDAAVEAIKKSPLWIPGVQNGNPVRVQYTISFAFSLAGN